MFSSTKTRGLAPTGCRHLRDCYRKFTEPQSWLFQTPTFQSSQSSSNSSVCTLYTLYTSSRPTAKWTVILNERSKLAGNGPSDHQQAQRKHHIPQHLEQLEPLPLNKPSRLRDRSKAVRHIGELQSSGRREVSREFASDPEKDKGIPA